MLHEYAVEPQGLAKWDTFKYLTDGFRISGGRLIARFPKQWLRMVDVACRPHFTFIQGQKLTDRLNRIKKEVLVPSGRVYDGERDWIDNALEQHGQVPFHGVIASENHKGLDFVLVADEIDDESSLWNLPREREVARTPEALGAALVRLLRYSERIVFVDKLFDPGSVTPRWREILCEFVALAIDRQGRWPVFEYHTKMDESAFNADDEPGRQKIREYFEDWLADKLPRGVEITVVLWSGDFARKRMHARCVLTERGGIRIDAGLDRAGDGHMTDVILMDTSFYGERWAMFCDASDLFRSDSSRFREESEAKGWVHAVSIKRQKERSHV